MRTPVPWKYRLGVLLLVLAPIVWLGSYIGGGFQRWYITCTQEFRLTNPDRDAGRLPAIFEQAKTSAGAKATALEEGAELKPLDETGHFRLRIRTVTSSLAIQEHFNALMLAMNQSLRTDPAEGPPLEILEQLTPESYGPSFPLRTVGTVSAVVLVIAGLWLVVENRARQVPASGSDDERYVPPPEKVRDPEEPPKYDY